MDSLTGLHLSTEPGYTAGRLVYSPLDEAHEDFESRLERYSLRLHLKPLLLGLSLGRGAYGFGHITPHTIITP